MSHGPPGLQRGQVGLDGQLDLSPRLQPTGRQADDHVKHHYLRARVVRACVRSFVIRVVNKIGTAVCEKTRKNT